MSVVSFCEKVLNYVLVRKKVKYQHVKTGKGVIYIYRFPPPVGNVWQCCWNTFARFLGCFWNRGWFSHMLLASWSPVNFSQSSMRRRYMRLGFLTIIFGYAIEWSMVGVDTAVGRERGWNFEEIDSKSGERINNGESFRAGVPATNWPAFLRFRAKKILNYSKH